MGVTILTGGAGFIGSNILRKLNAEGYDNILVVDELGNTQKESNLIGSRYLDFVGIDEFYGSLDKGKWNNDPIDAILHQGACTDTTVSDIDYMMRTNYESSCKLLDFALRRDIRMIYASTAAVYGHTAEGLESEQFEFPLNAYGISKLKFDNYVRRTAHDSTSLVVGLRYFNVFGPGEEHKGRMSSMVYQFTRQIQQSGVAKLFGDIGGIGAGEQTRDFVSVHDIVDMNLFFLVAPPVSAIVNAGSGVRSSWNQVAQTIICALGYGKIEYIEIPGDLKDRYQLDSMADLTNLRKLGYSRPTRSLVEEIKSYVGKIACSD
jgi:ADP-L-glycero-D-manno-heptose 6-epimerase